jgi:broad specificity phosphatase PhoE
MSAAAVVRVFLVRHGETEYNRDWRVQGSLDIELNETGVAQAKAAAAWLAHEAHDAVVVASSHLKRAARTADEIADAIAAARGGDRPRRVINEGLREMSFGRLEGACVTKADNADADEFRRVWRLWEAGDMHTPMPGTNETPLQATDRVQKALADVVSCAAAAEGTPAPVRTIIVVGHGRSFRFVLARVLGIPVSQLQLANAAISLVRWCGGDRFEADFLNSTAHLASETAQPMPTMSEVLARTTK